MHNPIPIEVGIWDWRSEDVVESIHGSRIWYWCSEDYPVMRSGAATGANTQP